MRLTLFTICLLFYLCACGVQFHSSAQSVTVACPHGYTTQTLSGGTIQINCNPAPVRPTPITIPPLLPPVSGIVVDAATFAAELAKVRPGDTLLLKGGVYKGPFISSRAGTASEPIVIKPYLNERPTLDAPRTAAAVLKITGAFTTVEGLEIACSDGDRTQQRPHGIDVAAPSVTLRNLIIHDNGNGVFAGSAAPDLVIDGCVVYRNGWRTPERAFAHGLYLQNETGSKTVTNSVIFDNYFAGVQIYTEGGALNGFLLDSNTLFNNGSPSGVHRPNILIGGYKPAERVTLSNNVTYHPLSAGTTNVQLVPWAGSTDLTLLNNYFAGATETLWLANWQSVNAKGNTLIAPRTPARVSHPVGEVVAAPSGQAVFVRQNHLAIFNWSKAASASVDLSGVLKVGENFSLLNVQDLSKAVLSGVFNGAAISIPTPAEFNAYMIRRTQ